MDDGNTWKWRIVAALGLGLGSLFGIIMSLLMIVQWWLWR
jgi:hypothetical protein